MKEPLRGRGQTAHRRTLIGSRAAPCGQRRRVQNGRVGSGEFVELHSTFPPQASVLPEAPVLWIKGADWRLQDRRRLCGPRTAARLAVQRRDAPDG